MPIRIGGKKLTPTAEKAVPINTSISSPTTQILEKKKYLSSAHEKHLKSSGIDSENALKAGYRSINAEEGLELLGQFESGILIPYFDSYGNPCKTSDGRDWARLRADKGDKDKYRSAKNAGCKPYFDPLIPEIFGKSWNKISEDTRTPLAIVEGEKKTTCFNLHYAKKLKIPALGVGGIWNWVGKKEEKSGFVDEVEGEEDEVKALLPELEAIQWKKRIVYLLPDSDIVDPDPRKLIKSAVFELAKTLARKGAIPKLVMLPQDPYGEKNGLDDICVSDFLGLFVEYFHQCSISALAFEGKGKDKKLVLNLAPSAQKQLKFFGFAGAITIQRHCIFKQGLFPYFWQETHWKLGDKSEFDTLIQKLMDKNGWDNRSKSHVQGLQKEISNRLFVSSKSFNKHRAFSNGTVIFENEKVIFSLGHKRNDFCAIYLPYEFPETDPGKPEMFVKFLNAFTLGEPEAQRYIRAMLRYYIQPLRQGERNKAEAFPLFVGQPQCGKGILFSVVRALLGEENCKSFGNIDDFSKPEKLAKYLDSTLIYCEDLPGFAREIKGLNYVIDNVPVTIKKLFIDPIDDCLNAHVLAAANQHLSVGKADAGGLKRRLHSFVVPLEDTIIIDPDLADKLKSELPKILYWLLQIDYERSLKDFRQGRLYVPALMEGEMESLEAIHPLLRFVNDCREERLNDYKNVDSVPSSDLYSYYRDNWSLRTGEKPLTKRSFERELKQSIKVPFKSIGRNNLLHFQLLSTEELASIHKKSNKAIGSFENISLEEIYLANKRGFQPTALPQQEPASRQEPELVLREQQESKLISETQTEDELKQQCIDDFIDIVPISRREIFCNETQYKVDLINCNLIVLSPYAPTLLDILNSMPPQNKQTFALNYGLKKLIIHSIFNDGSCQHFKNIKLID
ncbi:MAG: DUF3854 domain-containing protein [Pelatocladus maniniholoensis HA4357-MV3]|jgi:phage/plasmid-associated DNA primase|uniref:DUF3854 domain-containing protein n=1 Tax=Pelatocladus maniniholoensis HA4357-MV3 TaxID=1117104 RepID=A0A9E3HDY8_9NOST|nr:DUF3854 domain-containing protein [Pelatocladus maniniholoensis HA4357-MV3]